MIPLGLLALAWGQELLDQLLFAGRWNLPMLPGGPFTGVLTAPFSHGGLGHLRANSLAFLPLSWLVLLRGRRDYLAEWIGVYAAAIPVWLWWPAGVNWIGHLSGFIGGVLAALAVFRD